MEEQERMHRMQFYIPYNLRDELLQLSARKGVPMAELIREAIREYLHNQRLPADEDPALALIGLMRDNDVPEDVAVRHDDYIYDKDWER